MLHLRNMQEPLRYPLTMARVSVLSRADPVAHNAASSLTRRANAPEGRQRFPIHQIVPL